MSLTPAERRALDAMLRYGNVKGAAAALGRSPRTVDQQLRSARDRLGVTSNLEAARIVYIDGGKP